MKTHSDIGIGIRPSAGWKNVGKFEHAHVGYIYPYSTLISKYD